MKQYRWMSKVAVLLAVILTLTACGGKSGKSGKETSEVGGSDASDKGNVATDVADTENNNDVTEPEEPRLESFRVSFLADDYTVFDEQYSPYSDDFMEYFSVKTTDGRTVKFACELIYVLDGEIAMFGPSSMTCLTGLPRIDHIEFEKLRSAMDSKLTYGLSNDSEQIAKTKIDSVSNLPEYGEIETSDPEYEVENVIVEFGSKNYQHFIVGAETNEMWICQSFTVYYEAGTFEEAQITKREANKYMTVSAYGDNVAELVTNGKNVEKLVTLDQDGNRIEWLFRKLELQEDGKFCIREGGYLFNKTPIQGICDVTHTGNDEDGDRDIYHQQTGLVAYEKDVKSIDDIMWAQASYTHEDEHYSELMGYLSYYCMDVISGDITFESFTLGYMDEGFTGLGKAFLMNEDYGNYMEGQYYDPTKERFNPDASDYTFFIVVMPDTEEADADNSTASYGIPMKYMTIGDLYDGKGNVKSKEDPLRVGDCLKITILNQDFMVRLPVYPQAIYQNMKEARGEEVLTSTGVKNVLVVPFYLANQAERATEAGISGIKAACGRVLDRDGNVTDYSGKNYSLSQYYDEASYGQLTLNSFVTDWYCLDKYEFNPASFDSLEDEDVTYLIRQVNQDYADILTMFDGDGDDIFDGVLFVCAFTGNQKASLGGATFSGSYESSVVYDPDTMANDGILNVSAYCHINEAGIYSDVVKRNVDGVRAETFIHEFGHMLGLIDYYDVSYKGINAVGNYDMQSGNVGDWNPYSKFAVGWIKPQVVSAQNMSSDTTTISLRPFATSGDCVVIPTEKTVINSDGTVSPFSEYLIVDYFTPEGVNSRYAAQNGLGGVQGVRIYHVDARMISIAGVDTNGIYHLRHENEELEVSEDYPAPWFEELGVEVFTNNYNVAGFYNLVFLQKSGKNTLTTLGNTGSRSIQPKDFFYAGESFNIENFGEFFVNGKMQDGSNYPYTITVKSISADEAVIEISK